eukprot:TRINITY_DN14433_c0_g1_i1.p1 TRINITY_DN14433_c0_g1~~TRINITY_DN14433_c0_g1_i1.p1  ORF type:complete len:475 (+),score=89.52 TRINITY_DN14433_c0_g1_i1:42-1466(+)
MGRAERTWAQVAAGSNAALEAAAIRSVANDSKPKQPMLGESGESRAAGEPARASSEADVRFAAVAKLLTLEIAAAAGPCHDFTPKDPALRRAAQEHPRAIKPPRRRPSPASEEPLRPPWRKPKSSDYANNAGLHDNSLSRATGSSPPRNDAVANEVAATKRTSREGQFTSGQRWAQAIGSGQHVPAAAVGVRKRSGSSGISPPSSEHGESTAVPEQSSVPPTPPLVAQDAPKEAEAVKQLERENIVTAAVEKIHPAFRLPPGLEEEAEPSWTAEHSWPFEPSSAEVQLVGEVILKTFAQEFSHMIVCQAAPMVNICMVPITILRLHLAEATKSNLLAPLARLQGALSMVLPASGCQIQQIQRSRDNATLAVNFLHISEMTCWETLRYGYCPRAKIGCRWHHPAPIVMCIVVAEGTQEPPASELTEKALRLLQVQQGAGGAWEVSSPEKVSVLCTEEAIACSPNLSAYDSEDSSD